MQQKAVDLFGGEEKLAERLVSIINSKPLEGETVPFFDPGTDPVSHIKNISRRDLLDQLLKRGINIDDAMPLDWSTIDPKTREHFELEASGRVKAPFPPTTLGDVNRESDIIDAFFPEFDLDE